MKNLFHLTPAPDAKLFQKRPKELLEKISHRQLLRDVRGARTRGTVPVGAGVTQNAPRILRNVHAYLMFAVA